MSMEFVPQGSIQQNSSTGSDNVLALVSRRAITLTNDSLVYSLMYASVGLNELECIDFYLYCTRIPHMT